MWRRWPANQVFIDGRYDAVLFDEETFEEYLRAHHDPAMLERIAKRYGVEILVLDAEAERRIAFLGADSPWARVYWDPVAEVYVRRAGAHAALAEEREFRFTTPETVFVTSRPTVTNHRLGIARWTRCAVRYRITPRTKWHGRDCCRSTLPQDRTCFRSVWKLSIE